MTFASDLRYALRSFRLRPGWAVAAIGTLALGIGANATMLGVVDRLLLRPPPHVRDPQRVVRLSLELADGAGGRFAMSTTSYPVFTDLERGTQSFAALAASAPRDLVLGSGGDARAIPAALVTGGYFELLGTAPAAGRFFGMAEDEPPGERVAVLSYAFSRRSFMTVGQTIMLDGTSYRVIGVAPADFTGDDVAPVDVWVPLSAAMGPGSSWRDQRGMRLITIIGRLRDGVTAAAAADEGSFVARDADPSGRLLATTLAPSLGPRGTSTVQSRVALWVAGMSVVVFLIAIVNVANLLLLKAEGRRREAAVRLAIGASPADLARAHIVESVVLALAGGLAAVFVAGWASEGVRAVLIPTMAAPDRFLSLRLLAITGIATLASGLLASVVPAVRALRTTVGPDLKIGAGTAGRARSIAPPVLLVAQGSLCMVLLVAAGLFVLSLHRVRTQDFGFSADGVLIAELRFDGAMAGPDQDALYRDAADRVARVPGVDVVSVNEVAPFIHHHVVPIAVSGHPEFPDFRQQLPFLNGISPTYFRALGMSIRAGRNFTPLDRAGAPLVVIVNQALADGAWPGENPLGQCVRVGSAAIDAAAAPCREVVGVVNNARPRSIREEAGQARMQFYLPYDQVPAPGPFLANPPRIWNLLVRTADADAMAGPVQRALQSFAPRVTLADVQPLQDVLDRQMRPWLLGASMFSVFGVLALGLAAVGLYGVRAYSVAQRTQEIGIRMALGAATRNVMGMVLWEGVRVTTIGVVLGAVGALVVGRRLEPLLFETRATNGPVFALVAVALVLVAVLASAIPAWRAARVNPNVALRAE